MFNNFFFSKIVPFMEKYCTAGQATDNNMGQAYCMLDIKGYKHSQNV